MLAFKMDASSSTQNVATKRTSRPPSNSADKDKETDKKLVREYNRLSLDNFMDSFKETNRRVNRKAEVEAKNSGRKSPTGLYDKNGSLAGEDFCDCGDRSCEGCFFPCPKCYKLKCGHECRKNRKWQYESCIIEGEDILYRK
uniref:ARL14 effector protein n=2 Tax=Cacopsylla melanoneura TaxID=428564 RepID=A0A8D9BPG6_9HEMI